MDPEGACIISGFIISGISLLYMGTMTLRGKFKGLYLIKGIPFAAPASIVYTFFPAGIGALIYAVALVISDNQIMRAIIVINSFLIMLCAFVLMLWQPQWLKPWWLIWLEDNYPELLHTMLEEARQAGKAWEHEIRTQEDLEQWSRQVAVKYGRYETKRRQ